MDTHRSRAHALEVVGLKPGWSWAGLSYLNSFGYVSIVHCGCFVIVVVVVLLFHACFAACSLDISWFTLMLFNG